MILALSDATFMQLHPATQITVIVVGAIVTLGVLWILYR